VQWVAVGPTKEVYKVGLTVDTSILIGFIDVSGLTKGERDWLRVKWSRITVLRLRPGWKGVEVVRWVAEERWRVGVWAAAASSNLERSFWSGVFEKEGLSWGGDLIVTVFLGELCRVPEGLLCLLEQLREEGSEADFVREDGGSLGGVGVVLAELGRLELPSGGVSLHWWGRTGTTGWIWLVPGLLKGLMGFLVPNERLALGKVSAGLGVKRIIALLDTVELIWGEGVEYFLVLETWGDGLEFLLA
jgi:hypothetical protein